MKINYLSILEDAIEKISSVTEVSVDEIIDALIGIAWDEEDGYQLKNYFKDESDL